MRRRFAISLVAALLALPSVDAASSVLYLCRVDDEVHVVCCCGPIGSGTGAAAALTDPCCCDLEMQDGITLCSSPLRPGSLRADGAEAGTPPPSMRGLVVPPPDASIHVSRRPGSIGRSPPVLLLKSSLLI